VSKEIKEQIESISELQFIDEEIAIIMEIPISELISLYSVSIDRGRLRAEADVRAAILKAAKEGNPAAQKQVMQLNERAKKSSLSREDC